MISNQIQSSKIFPIPQNSKSFSSSLFLYSENFEFPSSFSNTYQLKMLKKYIDEIKSKGKMYSLISVVFLLFYETGKEILSKNEINTLIKEEVLLNKNKIVSSNSERCQLITINNYKTKIKDILKNRKFFIRTHNSKGEFAFKLKNNIVNKILSKLISQNNAIQKKEKIFKEKICLENEDLNIFIDCNMMTNMSSNLVKDEECQIIVSEDENILEDNNGKNYNEINEDNSNDSNNTKKNFKNDIQIIIHNDNYNENNDDIINDTNNDQKLSINNNKNNERINENNNTINSEKTNNLNNYINDNQIQLFSPKNDNKIYLNDDNKGEIFSMSNSIINTNTNNLISTNINNNTNIYDNLNINNTTNYNNQIHLINNKKKFRTVDSCMFEIMNISNNFSEFLNQKFLFNEEDNISRISQNILIKKSEKEFILLLLQIMVKNLEKLKNLDKKEILKIVIKIKNYMIENKLNLDNISHGNFSNIKEISMKTNLIQNKLINYLSLLNKKLANVKDIVRELLLEEKKNKIGFSNEDSEIITQLNNLEQFDYIRLQSIIDKFEVELKNNLENLIKTVQQKNEFTNIKNNCNK